MSADLLGREAERRWLASQITAVADGSRRTVLIRGEPGIGKSALLEDARRELGRHEFATCVATARQIERDRPFGVMRRALRLTEGASQVKALLDLERSVAEPGRRGLGLVDLPETTFQWIDAATDVLDEMLLATPVALIIDDAQWADDASLHTVIALHERLHDRPALMLLSARPTTESAPLAQLVSNLRPDDLLDVGPLDRAGVRALVTQVLGREPGNDELERVERAGGNPLFVTTLLADQTPDADGDDLPRSVQRLVTRSIHELGEETRRLLETLSVIGKPVPLSTLAIHAGQSVQRIVPSIDRALTSALLVDLDHAVAFRHDLVRDVVYESIKPAVRAAMHLSIGERMLEHDAPVEDVASHFLLGARTGDIEAAKVLRRAAANVARVAPALAANLLERVLDIVPADHPERDDIVIDLVRLSVFSDRIDTGMALIDQAARAGVRPTHEVELRAARTQMFFLAGDPRRAAAEFDQLITLVRGTDREPVIYADASVSAMFSVDLASARTLAERSLEIADRSADVSSESLALGVLAWLTALDGDLIGGLALAERAVESADLATGHYGHRRIPHLFHTQCLLWCDHVVDAQASLRRGRRLSAELGMGWDEPMYHAIAADERYRAGEWDDALTEIDAGLRRSGDVGARFADSWLYVHRARILFARGEFEQAGLALDGAMNGLAGAGGQGVDQLWFLRGMLAAQHDPATGLEIMKVLWSRLDDLGVRLRQFELAPDVVRVALRAGADSTAGAIVSRVVECAEAWPSQQASTAAAHCQALLAADRDALLAVGDAYERRSLPIEAIRARVDAVSIGGLGEQGDLGLTDVVVGQLSELGAHGLRIWHLGGSQQAIDARPSSGWDSLTRSERSIVALVGQGKSNMEIADALSISRRTVESHLYHAYPKLGFSTRVELALEAAKRQDLEFAPSTGNR